MEREVEIDRYDGEKNPFIVNSYLGGFRSKLNMFLVMLAKKWPFQSKKRILRWAGVNIGENVFISHGTYIDGRHPEKISIGDNTLIGSNTRIYGHAATMNEYRKGKVKIGEEVLIGTGSIILPGVKIGNNAKIAAGSLVNRNVEEGEFVGGTPIETIEEDHR